MAVLALAPVLALCSCSGDDGVVSKESSSAPSTSAGAEAGESSVSHRETVVTSTVTVTAEPEDDDTAESTSVPQVEPQVNPCSPEIVREATPEGWEVAYCDGSWARVELPNSDGMSLSQWNGSEWRRIDKTGMTMTGFKCYEPEVVAGVPDDAIGNLTVC